MSGYRGHHGGTPPGNMRRQWNLPPPVDEWGQPGFGRTEAGFRTRPGDRMLGGGYWGPEARNYNPRNFDPRHSRHNMSTPRGRTNYQGGNLSRNNRTVGSTRTARGDQGVGDKKGKEKASAGEDKVDKNGRKEKATLDELSDEQKVYIGQKLEKDGKFLFKFPEDDEDKRRISGTVTKFFEDIRCELGDKTFMEMFAKESEEATGGAGDPTNPKGGVEDPTSPKGGAGATGGVDTPEIEILKDLSTRSKITGKKASVYEHSAMDRLQFFGIDGEESLSGSKPVNDSRGEEEARHGVTTSTLPSAPSRLMSKEEKTMVNTVIEDIVEGRVEGGEKLWTDIRERRIPDSEALVDVGLFFRRQYNEGITKLQAMYCLLTLRDTLTEEDIFERKDEDEDDVKQLLDDETLDKFIDVAYDGNKEEAKSAILERSKHKVDDDEDIVPKELQGFQLNSFATMDDYLDYMQEVSRKMLENVAVVEEKCKVNAINDRKKLKERREAQRELDNRTPKHVNQPSSGNRTGSRRVDFDPTLRNHGDGTYNVGRSGISGSDTTRRPARYSSTPNAPRAGVLNNHNDSSLSHEDGGLTARELSIYEQYHVPPELRRSNRLAESSPLLSSTMAGDQPQSHMQSLINMVPTGSSLDMFRKFSGNKCDFLEWKHETQMLLGFFPESLRVMKLKGLLKEKHKPLVGHIGHDDHDALGLVWNVLDQNFGGTSKMGDYHMDQLTGWMRDGKKCHDYESLSHLYNFIKRHYYGMARLGAEKIPMAESFAYAIAPLLYGKSQREVNKLKHKDTFNVSKILSIIADHAAEVKDQEEDKEKYAHRSAQYTEEDCKFLRDRYFEEKGYKRYSRKGKYGDGYERSSSRGRSPYNSKDRYRGDSRDSARYSSNDQSNYTGYRSLSRERDFSGERQRYYKKDRRERSDDRPYRKDSRERSEDPDYSNSRREYNRKDRRERSDSRGRSRDRSRRDWTAKEDQEAVMLRAEEERLSSAEGKESQRYRRTRDQTPRGSRSKSPLRRPASRSWNSWACSLCLCDDHKTIQCRKYSADEVHRLCDERKLCYVCNLSGHVAAVCNAESLLCKSSGCTQEVNHNHLLCAKFKRA